MRFSNGSICVPHYSEELHPVAKVDDESWFLPVRPYVGEVCNKRSVDNHLILPLEGMGGLFMLTLIQSH